MKKINKLLSLLLIFAGIAAFDIKATEKQTESKEESKPEDKKTRNEEANELLWDAIFNNNIGKIKEALAKGADINVRNKIYGYRPLIRAARSNNSEIVKLLLENKANVNGKDLLGRTALMVASKKGYDEIVKLLLKYNADTSIIASNNTALSLALEEGDSEIAKLLLKNGADITFKNRDGRMLLDLVNEQPKLQKVLKEYHSQVCKQIIEAGLLSDLSDITMEYLGACPKSEKKSAGKSEAETGLTVSK